MLSKQSTNTLFKNSIRQFSLWANTTAAPPDPILGLNESFKRETNPKKVLLGMGVFRDNDNKPYILSCVKKATDLINSRNLDHEYAPI